MVDLKALIAKAQAEIAENSKTAQVEIGGELVDVVLRQVPGHVWADLIVTHPARTGSDEYVGFNSDALVRDYPVEYVTVAEEPVDVETWQEMYDTLTSPSIKGLAAVAWALNQNDPAKRIVELGKARAGGSTKRRRSPAK